MTTYDRIRLMFPDHLGLPRGKYLPIRLAEKGTNHCVTVFALGYDRSMIPAPGSFLLEGLRDVHSNYQPDTVRPGWEDDRTGVAVGSLTMDGKPYTYSPRYALEQALADWEKLGYTPQIGIELEAYVLESDGDGGWKPWHTPRAMVYGTGRGSDPDGLIDDIVRTAERCEFRVESINAEFDEAQFELTLEYDSDAMKAVDDAFLFRILAREKALEYGMDMTFMGRPFNGISGTGVHINLSLVDSSGANVFDDPDSPDGLSPVAHHCIAGLVHHHQGLAPLCAPTVNAYRRLRPGEMTGYWANWGHEHRFAAYRIPSERGRAARIESRLGDGAMNLHLGVAATLQAARLGVLEQLEPPEPLVSDGMDEVNTEVCVGGNLAEALEHLKANEPLIEAVGTDVCANFIANKEAEWERFLEAGGDPTPSDQVTQWELDEYLMFH